MKPSIVFRDRKIEIPVKTGFVACHYDDLMYIVYDGVYCYIHCMDKKYRVETSLKYLKDYLPKDVFFECNRSTIINIRYIKEYKRFDSVIQMEDKCEFNLSRRRVKVFHQIRSARFYDASSLLLDTVQGFPPLMLDDLTSGFNTSVNLSLEKIYNEMMGFTQEEVEWLMVETGIDPALITVDMSLYYNGYLFHAEGENRLYNPSMILYFFGRILRDGKITLASIIDPDLKTAIVVFIGKNKYVITES